MSSLHASPMAEQDIISDYMFTNEAAANMSWKSGLVVGRAQDEQLHADFI